jgi:hypothetical protein
MTYYSSLWGFMGEEKGGGEITRQPEATGFKDYD